MLDGSRSDQVWNLGPASPLCRATSASRHTVFEPGEEGIALVHGRIELPQDQLQEDAPRRNERSSAGRRGVSICVDPARLRCGATLWWRRSPEGQVNTRNVLRRRLQLDPRTRMLAGSPWIEAR